MNTKNKYVMTIDDFSSRAEKLKNHFQDMFKNPLQATEERFQWDYWHLPGQYTVVRTPADRFFSEALFDDFKSELEDWGLKNLGCGEISPTWLSYYVEGCEQLFHADNPHGPWAFVFSLTDWVNRKFSGGETKLLSENVLNYWQDFDSSKGFEEETLLQRVEPLFNRLTVFDPRVPHGVETVRGEKDPRQARIVMHGWFLEPVPVLTGGLEGEELGEILGEAIHPVLDEIESQGAFNGYVALKLSISELGEVTGGSVIQNTLRSVQFSEITCEDVALKLQGALKATQFPNAKASSELILPLVFR